jgi:hypothetical protein
VTGSWSSGSKIVVLAFVTAWPLAATAGWFGPSSYDDCILENMKGVGDKWAASSVIQACRSKFPEKKVAAKPVQPAATSAPSTVVLPAKCYVTRPGSDADRLDPDCFVPNATQ